MEQSNFYSRSEHGDIEDLMESFRPGKYFVERKSDNKWLVPFCRPDTLNEEHWTSDPNKAMSWRTKPLAELEIIRMKLGDSALVTEHEFVDPPKTVSPSEDKTAEPSERNIIKRIWQRAYLDSEEDHVKILKEYGNLRWNKAIQEAVQCVFKNGFTDNENQTEFLISELNKLKV